MTLQTNKNDPSNGGRQKLEAQLRSIWLGWRDSNPRMLGPKPSALPLGDTLINSCKIISLFGVRIHKDERFYSPPASPSQQLCKRVCKY